ncbi:MAG: acyl-CoA thioesterase [Acidimicrobiia bacterium]
MSVQPHYSASESLDALVAALTLTSTGTDRFLAPNELPRFPRIFGGQLLAQAIMAAGLTTPGIAPASIHGYFLEPGSYDQPIDIAVERLRSGRSMFIRQVTLAQGDRTLLVALVALHDNPAGPVADRSAAFDVGPEELVTVEQWVQRTNEADHPLARQWVTFPPPFDIRLGEPLTIFGGPNREHPRPQWMRPAHDVAPDPLLHAALLAYASDFFLVDIVFRSHPDEARMPDYLGTTIDHSIWFHRPSRLDGWFVHTQQAVDVVGHRGLAHGAIHDSAGRLMATVMQDVLTRPT